MNVYAFQDKNYLEINKIKNITSIKIYNLLDKEIFNRNYSVVGLLVFYGENQILNYTEDELYFPYFFETVKRVYKEESKNNVIYVDPETEFFLNTLNPKLNIEEVKNNIGKVGVKDKKIYYKIKNVETHYNILEYVIENLMLLFNRHIDIVDIRGVGSNLALKVFENGVLSNLEFTFASSSDTKFTYVFKGILGNTKELYVDIIFENKLEINFYDENKNIYGIHKVDDSSKTLKTKLFIDGKCKSDKTLPLELLDKNNFSEYLSKEESEKYTSYLLPWKDVVLINEVVEEASFNVNGRDYELTEDGIKVIGPDTVTIHAEVKRESFIYISKKDNHVRVLRQNKILKSKSNPSLNKLSKIKLKTGLETSITNYYMVSDRFIIKETTFVPSNLGNDLYNSELDGKSFYKVYEKLDDGEYVEYSTIKEGIKGYQLLDDSELSLILKRGVK